MDKYSITQLAEATNTPARTIRYYIAEGLLPKPPQGPNAYYTRNHFDTLHMIKDAKEQGLSLDHIRLLVVEYGKTLADPNYSMLLPFPWTPPWFQPNRSSQGPVGPSLLGVGEKGVEVWEEVHPSEDVRLGFRQGTPPDKVVRDLREGFRTIERLARKAGVSEVFENLTDWIVRTEPMMPPGTENVAVVTDNEQKEDGNVH